MTEQELIESIAIEIAQHTENCPWLVCSKSEQDAAYRSARFIYNSLVKEALPELAKEAGYVMGKPNLSESSYSGNQELPMEGNQQLPDVIGTTLDGQPLIKPTRR